MNWYVHGVNPQVVGEEPDEGGYCKHLKKGDVAYGYSGEADSFGEERYLKCKPCYEAFLAHRKTEPIECSDCGNEFPRNTLHRYIPYFLDGSPSEQEDAKLWLCASCQGMPRHLLRLESDAHSRELDDIRDQEWYDIHGPDEEPDDDDEEPPELEREKWTFTVYEKGRINGGRYSNGIQKIVVTGTDIWPAY